MLLWVLTQLVGPSLSAVIDGVSYFARLNVNDLYTARLRRRGCSTTPRGCRGTQNAIPCPDFSYENKSCSHLHVFQGDFETEFLQPVEATFCYSLTITFIKVVSAQIRIRLFAS